MSRPLASESDERVKGSCSTRAATRAEPYAPLRVSEQHRSGIANRTVARTTVEVIAWQYLAVLRTENSLALGAAMPLRKVRRVVVGATLSARITGIPVRRMDMIKKRQARMVGKNLDFACVAFQRPDVEGKSRVSAGVGSVHAHYIFLVSPGEITGNLRMDQAHSLYGLPSDEPSTIRRLSACLVHPYTRCLKG